MSSAELNSNARKRARKEGEEEASETSTLRSSDFYFNDGTIVLRAASKNDNSVTMFRVHQSLLALHCTVFRDMFGDEDTARFAGVSERYDDVPIMHLHDDIEDVEDFLRALYHPEYVVCVRGQDTS